MKDNNIEIAQCRTHYEEK
ncbi:MAG: hypothetical protein AB7U45_10745 [Desulfamplus sp.]